ncbi:opine metallophore biosynthesis dehydrogenase [Paenibacillus oryzisoli]|uniref:DUF2338 domain-containing protein n=1 Tax=Paenibacillus oryzisoli TaxID=1850517 RepID=A0A198A1I8_9BACL|nr:opine metallophore biosynthesis dehydrogenase [Paenibacillus oryzisoli]OAS14878.1 hypothetical protein A8708_05095 [Paenibacillus oryzisoli]
MRDFKRILLLGTGPATLQLAVSLKNRLPCYLGIAGRVSARSEQLFGALDQNKRQVHVNIQNEKHRALEGMCVVDQVFKGYDSVTGNWDTLFIAVTTDAYLDVLSQLSEDIITGIRCIILVSPTLGSNRLVRNYMNAWHTEVEIISFSTYLGDTRWLTEGTLQPHVLTTAVKKKIFAGSTQIHSANILMLQQLFEQLGITLVILATPIEAETRNISLYVHPALFMNEFSLDAIFSNSGTQKYVYKMFPEGPITQYVIRDMLNQWKEIMTLLDTLKIKQLNLLQFMTDDNYPIRLESLSRHDIEHFSQFDTTRQEYLLYIRYTSLLIDPYSEPDETGKYFDFSGVPFRKLFINREGELDVPRMPKEDYYRTKIIQGMMTNLGLQCPTITKFLHTYERKLMEAAQSYPHHKLSPAFEIQSFSSDIKRINSELFL